MREMFLNHKINGAMTTTHECPPFAIINPDDEKKVKTEIG
jgi:hypothetical protein